MQTAITKLGHASAVLVIVSSTLYLANFDGGFGSSKTWTIALVMALALPMFVAEANRMTRRARLILGALFAGIILNAVFARYRVGFPDAATGLFLLPATVITGHRLVRMRWGAWFILATIAAMLLWSWQIGASAYMGSVWSDQIPRWLPLSWPTQSAALMAGTGLFLIGASTRLRTGYAFAAGIVGALGLGAVWLTRSRSGLIATLLGVAVLLAMSRDRRRLVRASLSLGGAAIVTVAFLAVSPDSNDATVSSIGSDPSVQYVIDHWRAGFSMFADAPITGHGLGSYGSLAPQFGPPEAVLTAFAHNEMIEHLAEGGLVIALPLLLGLIGAINIGYRRLVQGGAEGPPTDAITTGAVVMFVVLGVHSLFSFDWAYPILTALLGISVGVMLGIDRHEPQPTRWRMAYLVGSLVVAAAVVMMAVSALNRYPGTFGFDRSPFNAQAARSAASDQLRQNQPELALNTADASLRWHSGDTTMITIRALARVELDTASVADVLDTLAPGQSRLSVYATVVDWLYESGELEEAVTLADELIGLVNLYSARLPDAAALEAWETKFLVAQRESGCAGVAEVNAELVRDPFVGGDPPRLDAAAFTGECDFENAP